MHSIFLGIYRIIKKRTFILLSLLLLAVIGASYYGISKLGFNNDYTNILPASEKMEEINEVLTTSEFLDQIVFHVTVSDTLSNNKHSMLKIADALDKNLNSKFVPSHFKVVKGRMEEVNPEQIYGFVLDNLPVFLTESDYKHIVGIIDQDSIDARIGSMFRSLMSPAGMVMRNYFFKDPLGLAGNTMLKFKDLQVEENFKLKGGFVATLDEQHILLFAIPVNSGDTRKNKILFEEVDYMIDSLEQSCDNEYKIEYFGSAPIAVANATTIQNDIQLSVSIALLLIIFLLLYHFRNVRYLFLVLLPAAFGCGIALGVLGIINREFSTISFGIGSVLLGISVDYALHILTHLHETRSAEKTLKDVSSPVLLSSVTTATAFFCLVFISSKTLHDLGLFAGISV
ncbi:MAG: MMPL family transporter, partial [Bacteroidales bacterium]|nr:MMPL family transporter [Bacteroidales bacterium]